jgi:5-methylcytosine-specific restriction endonuclease McrA
MAHKKYTKTELKKLLVEERAKSRAKQLQSAFMNRSRGIYTGQVNRFMEIRGKPAVAFPYTLAQFREQCRFELQHPCLYCHKKMTPKSMCGDHRRSIVRGGSFKLSNVRLIHQNCNWRKGLMNEDEYIWLCEAVDAHLAPIAAADLWKRLGIGGKWGR